MIFICTLNVTITVKIIIISKITPEYHFRWNHLGQTALIAKSLFIIYLINLHTVFP